VCVGEWLGIDVAYIAAATTVLRRPGKFLHVNQIVNRTRTSRTRDLSEGTLGAGGAEAGEARGSAGVGSWRRTRAHA
jgi:hypothetical protein